MIKIKKIFSMGLISTFITLNAFAKDNIPNGWMKAGSNPEQYEIGVDKSSGKTLLYIKGLSDNLSGFGTVMQTFSANKYLGKRLKLSASVKSDNVTGWAGLWMRVDGKNRDVLSFDNMENRAIKGSTKWKKYEVILDVPKESKFIAFGVLTSGKGTVFVDEIKFAEVDKNVKTTDIKNNDEPQNLNFEN